VADLGTFVRVAPRRRRHQRDVGVDIALPVRDVLQRPARGLYAPIPLPRARPLRESLHQPAFQMRCSGVAEGRELTGIKPS
jgi:hypothetical protein